jgi:recombination protein RecT
MNQIVPIDKLILSCKEPFKKQNAWGLKFETECLFAKQQLLKNDYTLKAAQANQVSLRSAILNVAAIGISLNPATAHAYLVPRDGAICLDISYRGLVKLATDSGAIKWAKAVLVYEGDTFNWRGPAEAPVHEADVFAKDRINAQDPLANLKGGYCLAKLQDGEYMVDVMTADEILAVRDSSKAKNGPWKGAWAGEMAKKTLVKRASKSWPQSDGRQRLDDAIQILNSHEGLEEHGTVDEEQIEHFMNLVAAGDGLGLIAYMRKIGDDAATTCYNAAPKGQKVKLKDTVSALTREAHNKLDDYATQIRELCQAEDPAVIELVEELEASPIEWELVAVRLTDIEHRQIQNIKQEQAA